MNSIAQLTPQQLRNAADIQERILSLQNELNDLLSSGSESSSALPIKRRRLSSQRLANIRGGARKRWGAIRTAVSDEAPRSRRGKRKVSAAGRARIAAALKARWRAAKRAGRNAL